MPYPPMPYPPMPYPQQPMPYPPMPKLSYYQDPHNFYYGFY
jgi:hypothetical protein